MGLEATMPFTVAFNNLSFLVMSEVIYQFYLISRKSSGSVLASSHAHTDFNTDGFSFRSSDSS